MDLNKYKKVETTKLDKRDQMALTSIILLLFILLAFVFDFNKSTNVETEETELKLNPIPSETGTELVQSQITLSDLNFENSIWLRIDALKKKLITKGHTTCAIEMQSAFELYQSYDNLASITKFSCIIDKLIKFNIDFLYSYSYKKSTNHLYFAMKQNMISKSDRLFLLNIKAINNINRFPMVEYTPTAIKSDLDKTLYIIENLI